jgi:hypothetical protein
MSGEPWTAAWEEAEASNPPGVDTFHTIELIHPEFVDDLTGPFSVRAVNGTPNDQSFTLEAGAPLNGGEVVTFKAIAFSDDHPEFAEGQAPSCMLAVDGVGEEISPYLENVVSVRADLICIYRQYRSDDTTEPCYGPVQFVIKKVTLKQARLEGTAMLKNFSNLKFPNKVFTYDEFPGLLQN